MRRWLSWLISWGNRSSSFVVGKVNYLSKRNAMTSLTSCLSVLWIRYFHAVVLKVTTRTIGEFGFLLYATVFETTLLPLQRSFRNENEDKESEKQLALLQKHKVVRATRTEHLHVTILYISLASIHVPTKGSLSNSDDKTSLSCTSINEKWFCTLCTSAFHFRKFHSRFRAIHDTKWPVLSCGRRE